MSRRGQNSFEFILVVAGVLLVVIVLLLILRSSVSSAGQSAQQGFSTHSQTTGFADWWVAGRGVAESYSYTRYGGINHSVPEGTVVYFFNDVSDSHSFELFDSSGALVGSGQVASTDGSGQAPPAGTYNFSWDGGANNSLVVESPLPPVSLACGATLSQSASLSSDLLDCPANGIVIGADGITLDCAGRFIDGDVSDTNYGIYLNNRENVTIKNCVVTDFELGLYLLSSRNNTLQNNKLSSSSNGIYLRASSNNTLAGNVANSDMIGIYLYLGSHNNTLVSNNASQSSGSGYYVYSNCHNNSLINNYAVSNSAAGIYVYSSNNNTISGNVVAHNGMSGVLMTRANSTVLAYNSIYSNDDVGLGITESNYCLLLGNDATSNGVYGISLYDCSDSEIEGNNASLNDFNGIDLEWYEVMPNNNHRIFGNIASFNGHDGIFIVDSSGNDVSNNVAESNGWNGGGGGFSIQYVSSSTFSGNTVNSSTEHGFRIYESDNNVLSGNNVYSNALRGMYLYSGSTGNALANNRVCTNTQGDFLCAAAQTDGGQNIFSSQSGCGIASAGSC